MLDPLLDSLFRYWGVDLIAMVLTFFAIKKLADGTRRGFALGIAGNVFWVALGVMTGSAGLLLANLAYAYENAKGWRQWKKKA